LLLISVLVGCGRGDAPADGVASSDRAQPGLVAWWKFDEGEGAFAQDASGNENTATLVNAHWSDGIHGGALEMTGSAAPDAIDDGIVAIPISDSLRTTADAMTVTAWTYRTVEHNVAVLAHEYPALFLGFHGPKFKWQFQGEPSTGILARLARTSGVSSVNGMVVHGERGVSCYRDLDQRAELNRWIHLAATFDGRRSIFYVDGIEICNERFWGRIKMPAGPFTISGYLNESNEILDEITGKIDEVRIYNRALGASEIRAIYQERNSD
jgi:hypothetical protein